MSFDKHIHPHNHPQGHDTEHFHHPESPSVRLCWQFPTSALGNHCSVLCHYRFVLLFLEFHIN